MLLRHVVLVCSLYIPQSHRNTLERLQLRRNLSLRDANHIMKR